MATSQTARKYEAGFAASPSGSRQRSQPRFDRHRLSSTVAANGRARTLNKSVRQCDALVLSTRNSSQPDPLAEQ